MADSSNRDPDREVLSGKAAEQLLARAAELDLHHTGGAEIANLRAAAVEAGIRPEAFDAALAEMRKPRVDPRAQLRYGTSPRKWMIFGGAVVALAVGIVISTVVRHPKPADLSVPHAPFVSPIAMVNETFQLHCLSSEQAGVVVAPLLGQGGEIIPSRTAGVIAVRIMQDHIAAVRSALDKADGPSCRVRGTQR